jgi:hypothetical protein
MAPYIAAWAHAHHRVFEVMGSHMEDSYVMYLRWMDTRESYFCSGSATSHPDDTGDVLESRQLSI